MEHTHNSTLSAFLFSESSSDWLACSDSGVPAPVFLGWWCSFVSTLYHSLTSDLKQCTKAHELERPQTFSILTVKHIPELCIDQICWRMNLGLENSVLMLSCVNKYSYSYSYTHEDTGVKEIWLGKVHSLKRKPDILPGNSWVVVFGNQRDINLRL